MNINMHSMQAELTTRAVEELGFTPKKPVRLLSVDCAQDVAIIWDKTNIRVWSLKTDGPAGTLMLEALCASVTGNLEERPEGARTNRQRLVFEWDAAAARLESDGLGTLVPLFDRPYVVLYR
jgi:hypothetical protein